MLVTELGLHLDGVPKELLDSTQALLDTIAETNLPGVDPRSIGRHYLRPHCGIEQDAAEALAFGVSHTHKPGADELCTWCGFRYPCPEVLAAARTFGLAP